MLDADEDETYLVSCCERYLEDGETFVPEYRQYPPRIPVDADVDQYWKTLLASRYHPGMGEVAKIARRNNLEINRTSIWKQRGAFVGDHLIPYSINNCGGYEEVPQNEVSKYLGR